MSSGPVPPQGFMDLAKAYTSPDNSFVNIIGVVVDLMPVTPTRNGNEFTMSFRLLDRSLYNWVTGSEGLLIRYFKNDQTQLPKVHSPGDVVLLRSVKMNTWAGQRSGLSNFQTECTVFPSKLIPDPSFAIAVQGTQRIPTLGIEKDTKKLNMVEQSYVMQLSKNMADVVHTSRQKHDDQIQRLEQRQTYEPAAKRLKTSGGFSVKFRLIKDLGPRVYADLCGEVVKSIAAGYGGCDLYITDYTFNDLLRHYDPPESASLNERDGDSYGYIDDVSRKTWPGPYGQLTIKINAKQPHASFASQLQEGDIVLLQNVKTRTTDAGPWLEGDMWHDHLSPEKINIKKIKNLDSPEIGAMLQRKQQYWDSRGKKVAQMGGELEQKDGNPNATKRKEKRSKAKRNKQDTGNAQVLFTDEEGTTSKLGGNPHVRCSYEDVPLSRIRYILDLENANHWNSPPEGEGYTLPFINAKYRAKVRVVDYEPKGLENFAVQGIEVDEEGHDRLAWQYDGTPKMEWYFSLQLEDATKGALVNKQNNTIWVQVHHEEAQFLFGRNLKDPRDLRQDSRLLAQLREKMFVLWGNLEESGGQGLSNQPFECCIQEYGIEMDEDDPARDGANLGWQRMYSMFGVTIL